jgi:hypothetical protein
MENITLHLECNIKDEYINCIDFLRNKYGINCDENYIPEKLNNIKNLYEELDIKDYICYFYKGENNNLTIIIKIKPYYHISYIPNVYERFLKEVITPLTNKIIKSEISYED